MFGVWNLYRLEIATSTLLSGAPPVMEQLEMPIYNSIKPFVQHQLAFNCLVQHQLVFNYFVQHQLVFNYCLKKADKNNYWCCREMISIDCLNGLARTWRLMEMEKLHSSFHPILKCDHEKRQDVRRKKDFFGNPCCTCHGTSSFKW